jgi:hypothetical protein
LKFWLHGGAFVALQHISSLDDISNWKKVIKVTSVLLLIKYGIQVYILHNSHFFLCKTNSIPNLSQNTALFPLCLEPAPFPK